MIRIPLSNSDPVEYLTRPKFPLYPHIEALQACVSTSGVMSREKQQKHLKDIETYKSKLRAKPPEELRALYGQEQEKERQELKAKAERDEQQRFFNLPDAQADFTHWSKAAYWTLDEAIALSFGKAPEVVKWEHMKKYVHISPFAARYGRVRDLALRAKASKQLHDPESPGIFLAWARRTEIEVPCELVEQVEARGIVIADWKDMFDKLKAQSDAYTAATETLFAVKEREIALLKQELDAQGGGADGPKWPWGSHETKLLRDLAAAADRFWKNYDPSDPKTAPKSEAVTDWLMKERGLHERPAQVMAQILRADGVPTGPRK